MQDNRTLLPSMNTRSINYRRTGVRTPTANELLMAAGSTPALLLASWSVWDGPCWPMVIWLRWPVVSWAWPLYWDVGWPCWPVISWPWPLYWDVGWPWESCWLLSEVADGDNCTAGFDWSMKSVRCFCIHTSVHTQLCLKKMHQLWNGIAQDYKDRFWRYLAEIFKIL